MGCGFSSVELPNEIFFSKHEIVNILIFNNSNSGINSTIHPQKTLCLALLMEVVTISLYKHF